MSFDNMISLLTQPLSIIIYVGIIVLIMIVVVITIMVNENRFNKSMSDIKNEVEQAKEEKKKEAKIAERASRFSMLKLHDIESVNVPPKTFNDDVTLRDFCEEFRSYAAAKLGLYYDIAVIREFIAGLAVSHIIILQGMSGTGKTSLAYAFGEFIGNPSVIIPVQPMWKERTDLLGYYNEFTKRFNETLLLQKMYEANDSKEIYITILDELNIARVEYYFAEFLSLLEIPNPESRYLDVVSDKWESDPKGLKNGRIKLPENMWFIGTANNDDSTFAISDKVYDRAMVLNIDRRAQPFPASNARNVSISSQKFVELASGAKQKYSVSSDTLEKLKIFDDYLISHFEITFGNRIMRQIHEYLPIYMDCGGTELDALDDILAKKVMRKLETQNTAYIKSEADNLCHFLDDVFGEDKMTRCKETVIRIAKTR